MSRPREARRSFGASTPDNSVAQANLLNRINLICPVHSAHPARRAFLVFGIHVKPEMKKISLYPKAKSVFRSARLTRQEGRIMIVTNVRWDAVDAMVPITNGADAYGEVVWS